MVASINGHKNIVKYLLSRNASVSLGDIDGATVTFLAASAGNYEVLKVLLTNPRVLAEIDMKDKVSCFILAIYSTNPLGPSHLTSKRNCAVHANSTVSLDYTNFTQNEFY